MSMDWLSEARGWVGTSVAVIVAWVAGRGTVRAKQIEAEAKRLELSSAPYAAVVARVERLEEQVGKLRAQVERLEDENEQLHDDAARYLAHALSLHAWIDQGSPPPPPVRPTWAVQTD